MARRSRFERLVDLASRLPWWVCLLLALGSYYAMHALAGIRVPAPDTLQQTSGAIAWQWARVLGLIGQVLFPLAFGLGALLSAIGQWKRQQLLHGQLMALVSDAAPVAPPAPAGQRDPVREARAAMERVAPTCPQCGSSMEKRTARKGASSGRLFWGCRTFPRCRGTRPLGA